MQKHINLYLFSCFSRMLPACVLIKKEIIKKHIDPSKAKVLFVPFADKENKYYIALCKQALMLCGISKSNISTLTSHTHKTAKADIIFVSGGNVCKLKDELTKIDWLDEIKNRILCGTIYIGDSAGSVLVGKTIEHTLKLEPYSYALQNYDGLKIIDKGIVVHFSKVRYSGKEGLVEDTDYSAHEEQTRFLGENNFLTIANNQMLIVKKGKIKSKKYSFKKIKTHDKLQSSKFFKPNYS